MTMLPIYLSNDPYHSSKHHRINPMNRNTFINEEKLIVDSLLSNKHAGIFSLRREVPTSSSNVLPSSFHHHHQEQGLHHAVQQITTAAETVDTTTSSSKWDEGSRSLGCTFRPGPYDVICGRGKTSWNHSGNKFFRSLVKSSTGAYSKVKTRAERSMVVSAIVETIRRKGNGFVKQEDNGEWIEVGDLLAREKIGQMLRNSLSTKYRSSITSKKQRRKEVHAKRGEILHDVMASNSHIHRSMQIMKKDSKNCAMSDAALLALFTQQQQNMLLHIQADEPLLERFLQAEVSAALVMDDVLDDNSNSSDGDIEMRVAV